MAGTAQVPAQVPQEVDLERTDQLPIVVAGPVDPDVADDAVRLDPPPAGTRADAGGADAGHADAGGADAGHADASAGGKAAAVDLPALADSVQSLEERVARKNAEYEALRRAFDERRHAEQAARARADRLDAELGDLRTRVDEARAGQLAQEQALAAQRSEAAAARAQLDDARRELKQVKGQAAEYLERLRTREWQRGFEDTLFRDLDAKIGVAQESHGELLVERDQLRQRVADLESKLAVRDEAMARLKSASQDDENARVRIEMKLRHLETERGELGAQVASLQSECSRLGLELAERDRQLAAAIAAGTTAEAVHGADEMKIQRLERTIAAMTEQAAGFDAELKRLKDELAQRDTTITQAFAATSVSAQQHAAELEEARRAQAEQNAELDRLRADLAERDAQIEVLVAHLQESRRPAETVQAEFKRLRDRLAEQEAAARRAEEDNTVLRAALERTRGALEEREFLIRRLEKSESNNASLLDRIQSSIERLGVVAAATSHGGSIPGLPAEHGASAAPADFTVELVRVDGAQERVYALQRRSRIGRAPGCEMQIDSSSVSRHHALVLFNGNEAVIEDLNSTNGVILNGRKIARQPLVEGDLLAIGEAQFRVHIKPAVRTGDPPAAAAGEP